MKSKFLSMAVGLLLAACSGSGNSSLTSDSDEFDPAYFANQDVQDLAPAAFALQPEALPFLEELHRLAFRDEQTLVNAITADHELTAAILRFTDADWPAKEKILRKIFALEVQALGIQPPKLVIEPGVVRGAAYFTFDLENQGPGTVYLNPDKIMEDSNPYLALLLLVHETRHSAQLQLSFNDSSLHNPLAQGYGQAFLAQRDLKITSFSDFLTLLNEYEAFRYANYVVGKLTQWQVDTLGLGTYASQFDANGVVKIDLLDLFDKYQQGELDHVLKTFNHLEKAQYDLLK